MLRCSFLRKSHTRVLYFDAVWLVAALPSETRLSYIEQARQL